MKKYLAGLLCIVLIFALMAGCSGEEASDPHAGHNHGEATESLTPSDSQESHDHGEEQTTPTQESHDHNHVNYKGLSSASYTLEDVIAAEGVEPAFSFESDGVTYYAYKNVTMGELRFSQVQHSFMGEYNRVSCTISGEEEPATVLANWEEIMTELYGTPVASENDMLRWTEHTGNFVTLTQLNEDTVQLCFYFTA